MLSTETHEHRRYLLQNSYPTTALSLGGTKQADPAFEVSVDNDEYCRFPPRRKEVLFLELSGPTNRRVGRDRSEGGKRRDTDCQLPVRTTAHI